MLVEAKEVGVGDVELLVGCVQIVRYGRPRWDAAFLVLEFLG
jgi:hypothetical protein